jgi:hypothetical protein
MRITGRIVVATGAMAAVLAVAGPAVAGPGGDAHDRAAVPGRSAVEFFYANERATMQDQGQAAIAYFRANERATMPDSSSAQLAGYVDGASRSGLVATETQGAVLISDDAFDWGAAAIGASSAFALAILLGGTLVIARHTRGRALAR